MPPPPSRMTIVCPSRSPARIKAMASCIFSPSGRAPPPPAPPPPLAAFRASTASKYACRHYYACLSQLKSTLKPPGRDTSPSMPMPSPNSKYTRFLSFSRCSPVGRSGPNSCSKIRASCHKISVGQEGNRPHTRLMFNDLQTSEGGIEASQHTNPHGTFTC